jgi:hypothetical protein
MQVKDQWILFQSELECISFDETEQGVDNAGNLISYIKQKKYFLFDNDEKVFFYIHIFHETDVN